MEKVKPLSGVFGLSNSGLYWSSTNVDHPYNAAAVIWLDENQNIAQNINGSNDTKARVRAIRSF